MFFIGTFFVLIIIFSNDFSKKFSLSNFRQESLCKTTQMAQEKALFGVLEKKFRDKENHNYKTIIINNNEKNINSIIFVLDESEAYNYLQKGDSIAKTQNSLSVEVYRGAIKKDFKLYYGCEK